MPGLFTPVLATSVSSTVICLLNIFTSIYSSKSYPTQI